MRPSPWAAAVALATFAPPVAAADDVDYLTQLDIYSLMAPCAGEAVSYNIALQTMTSACPSDAVGLQKCICSTSTSSFLSAVAASVRSDCGVTASEDQTSASLLWKQYCTQDNNIEFSTPTSPINAYITEIAEMAYLPKCAQSALSEAVMGNSDYCPGDASLYNPCVCSKEIVTNRVSKTIDASVRYSCSNKEDITAASDLYKEFCAMNEGTTSFKTPEGPPGDMTYYITALPQFKSLNECAQSAFTDAVQDQQSWRCPEGPQALASCACLKSGIRNSISSTLTSQVKFYCEYTASADVSSAVDVLDVYCKAAADETQLSISESVSQTGVSSRTRAGSNGPSETGNGNKENGDAENDGDGEQKKDSSESGGSSSGSDSSSGSNNTAAIAGGVVGGVVVLGLIALGVFFWRRRQQKRNTGSGPQMVDNASDKPELSGVGTSFPSSKEGAYPELATGPLSSPPVEMDPQQRMPGELAGQVAYKTQLSPDQTPRRSPVEAVSSDSAVSPLTPQDRGGMGWQSGPVDAYELGPGHGHDR